VQHPMCVCVWGGVCSEWIPFTAVLNPLNQVIKPAVKGVQLVPRGMVSAAVVALLLQRHSFCQLGTIIRLFI
jgi:hypothetical protein